MNDPFNYFLAFMVAYGLVLISSKTYNAIRFRKPADLTGTVITFLAMCAMLAYRINNP